MTAGGIVPFRTIVVGIAFNTFAQFLSSPLPQQQQAAAAQATLLHRIGLFCLESVALAVGSVALWQYYFFFMDVGRRNKCYER